MTIKTFFITTPIFYPNDRLHLGHAYTMIMADIIARYKKSKGYQVYFQTGSDDHGEKIEKKAISLDLNPQNLVDKNVLLFQQLWKKIGISEHNFYRTSSPIHKEKVQQVFTKLLKNNDIYLGKYKGNYCIGCEDYVSEGKAQENLCPSCHSSLRIIEESAYFLRINKYYSWLRDYYQQYHDFLLPDNIKKELVEKFLGNDVRDLCITRSDIKWGIPVPNEEKMVIYVWFEALCNYFTSEIGKKYFFSTKNDCEIIQIVGKDIARFHGIYWPIILKLVNARLPNKILAHGWILSHGDKMSKSKGNVLDPFNLLEKYPKDLLRSYFVGQINFFQDGILEENLLENYYQDFLVNNLSNLVSRINKMVHLYNSGIIPDFTSNENLENYYQECEYLLKEFQEKMDKYELTNAFFKVKNFLDSSNKMISDLAPWKIFQKKSHIFLNQILNHLVNRIKIITFLLNCIIPNTSEEIYKIFNINPDKINWDNCLEFNFFSKVKIKVLKKHLYQPLIK